MNREELLAAAAKEVKPCSKPGCPNTYPAWEEQRLPFCDECSKLLVAIFTEKKPCGRCGGTGMVSVGGGCMGYDDEPCPVCAPSSPLTCSNCGGSRVIHAPAVGGGTVVIDCPLCSPVNYTTGTPAAPAFRPKYGPNQCPNCGGSLCVEEWHDCESDREWRRTHA